MSRIIECCVRNVADDRRASLREGEQTLRVRPCLEHCDVCRRKPFRVVDGDLVVGEHGDLPQADCEADAE